MRDACPVCQREIFWLRHEESSKPAPIQVSDPVEGIITGNVIVMGDNCNPCEIESATRYRMIGVRKGEPLPQTGFVSHFARCREAPHFRDREEILRQGDHTP